MADYYPLLARAVAVLPASTSEARQAIYGRARDALLAQLRAIDPPIDPEDIQAESDALDAATARIEVELAAKAAAAAKPTPPPPAPAPARPAPLPVTPAASVPSPAATPPAPAVAPRPALPPRVETRPPSPAAKPMPPRPSGLKPLPPRPVMTLRPGIAPSPPVAPAPPTEVEPAPISPPPPAPIPEPEPVAEAAPAVVRPPPSPRPPALPIAEAAPVNRPAPPPPTAPPPSAPPVAAPTRRPLPPRPDPGQPSAPAVALPGLPQADIAPALAMPSRAAPEAVAGGPELGPPDGLGPKPRRPGFLKALNQSQASQNRRAAPAAVAATEEALIEAEALSQAEGAPSFDPTARETLAVPLSPARRDGVRPAAPQRKRESTGRLWRNIVFAIAMAVVVAAVAVLAFVLRDRPEDLARLHPSAAVTAPEPAGKIANRVGGATVTTPPRQAPAVSTAPTPAPSAPAPAPAAAALPAAAAPSAPAPIAVAQRAALLVGAPNDPQKVENTYVGTVVWRLDNISRGPGQPLLPAVRADIDIPDAKLKASLLIQKNTDDTLAATHTIEIRFMPAPDSPIPVVRQIEMPQMRNEDAATGDPLAGSRQPLQTNYFVVGLFKGDAMLARNLDLLRSRNWFNLGMQLDNNRLAKLTFEKGVPGDRLLGDLLSN